MKCPDCGKENSSKSRYCSNCGKSLNAKIICTNCG
ncbi:MAG: zinc-ribbon domain-containing protein, partial [Spirochaetes bacterium]|nr:zinc-ribbon domain-containing protein [Spirochaetota bacterium]